MVLDRQQIQNNTGTRSRLSMIGKMANEPREPQANRVIETDDSHGPRGQRACLINEVLSSILPKQYRMCTDCTNVASSRPIRFHTGVARVQTSQGAATVCFPAEMIFVCKRMDGVRFL